MAPTMPKMSLVAQYDDLCRYTAVLTEGIEDEFETFVKQQEICRKQWHNAEIEVQRLQQLLKKSADEKMALETKLKHVQSLVQLEQRKRRKIEAEKNSMERQIALIREVLLADQNAMNDQTKEKLAFLNSTSVAQKMNSEMSPKRLEQINESGEFPSDVSFDKTDDDFDTDNAAYFKSQRSKNKRRSTQSNTSVKKRKSEENYNDDIDTELSDCPTDADFPYSVPSNTAYETGPSRKLMSTRSNSEPAASTATPTFPRYTSDSDQADEFVPFTLEQVNRENSPQNFSQSGTPIRHFSSGRISNRSHHFCSKTVFRPEMCAPCGKRVKFYKQILKCQDCRVTCHPECKDKVPLPCVPTMQTPNSKKQTFTIADYSPSSPPMIPALIIYCVNEIETRGLGEVGLYRVSGSEREVKDLKERFIKGKCIPVLDRVDIHAICGTIKEFLRSLQEPLITRSLWKNFVNAAEIVDETTKMSAMKQALCHLPQPNRDTLAFLIMHLQKVAESPRCKMPLDNLAKVFGPTVVGYSSSEPTDSATLSETQCQYLVMLNLLKLPLDYLQNAFFMNNDDFNTIPKTPESRPAPEGNILGPLSTGSRRVSWSGKSRGVTLGKVPLTPSNTLTGTLRNGKRQFFTSPMLK